MDEVQIIASGGTVLFSSLENPNKMPFKGVLTYLDAPSDNAPGGSGGYKVLIPREVGEAALPSLEGMPVNLAASMDDHDTRKVIGVIEKAYLGEMTAKGVPVMVEGYIFAKNFPNEAAAVKMAQNSLGFSYETSKTVLVKGEYNGELVAKATSLIFTGAAILYKDSAAYTSTSLAASKETAEIIASQVVDIVLNQLKTNDANNVNASNTKEDFKMTEEQLKELMASVSGIAQAVNSVKEGLDSVKTEVADIKAAREAEEKARQEAADKEKAELEAKAKEEAEAKKKEEELKAAGQEPQRRSEASLINKFGTQAEINAAKEKATEIFASVDKKNLDPVQSMAAKLGAIWG